MGKEGERRRKSWRSTHRRPPSRFVVDRFGRRTLLIARGVQIFAFEVVIGGVMAAKLEGA